MLQRTCLAITKGRGADAYMLAIGIHVDLDDLELKLPQALHRCRNFAIPPEPEGSWLLARYTAL